MTETRKEVSHPKRAGLTLLAWGAIALLAFLLGGPERLWEVLFFCVAINALGFVVAILWIPVNFLKGFTIKIPLGWAAFCAALVMSAASLADLVLQTSDMPTHF